jgi:hypothetical protein
LARLIVALHTDAARAERLARAGRAILRSRFNHKQEDAALAVAIALPIQAATTVHAL